MARSKKLNRREFLTLSATAAAGALAAACQPQTIIVEKEKTVKETVVVEKEKTVKETVVVEKEVEKVVEKTVVVEKIKEVGAKEVPRERTLILMFGGAAGAFTTDVGIGNCYATGHTHQYGNSAMMEPLAFFSAFANKEILWLAEAYQYNEDATELVIQVRPGVEWADGEPFTAKDVAFTLDMLIEHAPELRNSSAISGWIEEVNLVDDFTVQIVFNKPNWRFFFDFLSFKFDTGNYIVPEHIFKDVEDPTEFLFYDLEKGWPIHTGPYRITLWNQTQKFLDRRDDWWAAKTGLQELPEVERIIILPMADETRQIQLMVNNVTDATHLSLAAIKTVIEQNDKIISHSGRDRPYGYIDWWPISMCFNDLEEPYSDPDIRWAISYALDRDQIIEIGYEGAGFKTEIPYPDYAALQIYKDSIQDLLEQYPTNEFNLSKNEELMKKKGWEKDGEGFWAKDGQRFKMDIIAWVFFGEVGPIIAEQLRKAGYETSYSQPADVGTRVGQGQADAWFYGHGGSIADPYLTLDLFHSRRVRPTGEAGSSVWRWVNEDFDAIVDEITTVPMGDPRLLDLFHDAMEIWLRELPDVPMFQWFHRIPMNTTYWDNWPTADNPYINGAWWHLTFPLILYNLKPVQ